MVRMNINLFLCIYTALIAFIRFGSARCDIGPDICYLHGIAYRVGHRVGLDRVGSQNSLSWVGRVGSGRLVQCHKKS